MSNAATPLLLYRAILRTHRRKLRMITVEGPYSRGQGPRGLPVGFESPKVHGSLAFFS